MKKVFVPGLVFLLLTLFSCNKEKNEDDHLIMDVSYIIDIPECSGLSWFDGNTILTVSDSLGQVYILDLKGNVLDTLAYTGDDIEGITYDSVNRFFYLVEEKDGAVVQLDSTGAKTKSFSIDIENIYSRHGLEGISYNFINEHLYLVSEKAPGLLIETTTGGEEISRIPLSFAKDFSSVFIDPTQNIWILSDDSESLTLCDSKGIVQQSWETGVEKGEGLLIDMVNRKAIIITDDVQSKLYFFSFNNF